MTSITPRDPFQSLFSAPFRDFDAFWQRAFGPPPAAHRQADRRAPVNVFETEDGIGIEAWLPGFSEDDIAVTVEQGRLTIRAERSSEQKDEAGEVGDGEAAVEPGRSYRRREFGRSVYRRSFRLDPDYDAGRISAALRNGVLEISLPKAERPQPQRIPITVGGGSDSADRGSDA